MLSSTIDLVVALASVIIAPFVVQGLIRAKGTVGRLLQLLLGLGVAAVFVVVWAYFGHDPLQIVYCTLDKNAPSCSHQIRTSPTAKAYGNFSDLNSLRDALNGLSEETPDAKLVELFGAPNASIVAKKPYRGEKVTLSIYSAGPFVLYVVRSPTHHIGFGVSRSFNRAALSAAPDAVGRTPTILLSGGVSWDRLENLTIGEIGQYGQFGNCDGRFEIVIRQYSWPMLSPSCFFGRAGRYAHYAFVFPLADVTLSGASCRQEYEQVEELGTPGQFRCASMNALSPVFVFMTKAEDVNPQEWARRIWQYNIWGTFG